MTTQYTQLAITRSGRVSFFIGLENWFLIGIFTTILFIIMVDWSHQGLEWISYASCALIIGLANSITLTLQYKLFSKIARYFLMYRILWSVSLFLSMLLLRMNDVQVLNNPLMVLFYLLALADIFANICSKTITIEVGPGFLPVLEKVKSKDKLKSY